MASGLSGQGGGRGDSDTRRGGSANVAEEDESGEALSAFTGKSGGTNKQSGKSGNGKSNVICGRCGERGHIKKDCPKKCGECGLKSCGGVKGRCMTKGGGASQIHALFRQCFSCALRSENSFQKTVTFE